MYPSTPYDVERWITQEISDESNIVSTSSSYDG
jgi:hypothetical protein